LAIVDLGGRAAHVSITTPTGAVISGQSERRVVPGSPLVIGPDPGAPFATAPFEVRSDQPVAVELDALPVAEAGVVVVPAFVPQ